MFKYDDTEIKKDILGLKEGLRKLELAITDFIPDGNELHPFLGKMPKFRTEPSINGLKVRIALLESAISSIGYEFKGEVIVKTPAAWVKKAKK